MNEVLERKLTLTARDASGQKKFAVRDLPADTTVQELVRGLIARMSLPLEDSTATPLAYHMFSEREGRHLQASETVGEALRDQDEVVLHPDVQAGGRAGAARCVIDLVFARPLPNPPPRSGEGDPGCVRPADCA